MSLASAYQRKIESTKAQINGIDRACLIRKTSLYNDLYELKKKLGLELLREWHGLEEGDEIFMYGFVSSAFYMDNETVAISLTDEHGELMERLFATEDAILHGGLQ